MSKKIGLLTIHSANSYGGALQSYATVQMLKEFGEVEVIDYRTKHLEKTMHLVRVMDGKRWALRAAKDLFRLIPRRRLLARFHKFYAAHYLLTPRIGSVAGLKQCVQQFDCIVVGSDQVWNPRVLGEFDPGYFFGFDSRVRKVSFASSAGDAEFAPAQEKMIKGWLGEFAHVSVREADTAKRLTALLGRQVTAVPDPTLMLDRHEWGRMARADCIRHGNYVLVYCLKNNVVLEEAISRLRLSKNYKIVAIDQNPFKTYFADEHVQDAGPLEFLQLVRNAKFILTNSFHGTAFAINFGIPFLTVEPEIGRNRIVNLLNQLNISERLVSSVEDIDQIIAKKLDVDDIWGRLDGMRVLGWEYLRAAMEVESGTPSGNG